MALEAVTVPQDLLSYGCKDLCSFGGDWSYEFGVKEEEKGCGSGSDCVEILEKNMEQEGLHLLRNRVFSPSSSMEQIIVKRSVANSSPEGGFPPMEAPSGTTTSTSGRQKRRRRTQLCNKNKEQLENQRMTHIVIERNRRKQMNDYFSVLQSLMPPSYVQRSDQASIIGGAINFVKELEHHLQSLEAYKRINKKLDTEFFTFPQNSSCSTQFSNFTENRSAIADIEVMMVESHANLKVVSKRRPKQLLKMVSGLESLGLTILHLNVTTIDQMILYSFSIKVEDVCLLTSVDEIASAVYELLDRIQKEATLTR